MVNSAIIFNKHSALKSTIINKTFADFNEDYQVWSNNVKERLERKRKIIEDGQKLEERKKLSKSLPSNV